MAKKAYKRQNELSKISITKESIKFIYNKYKSIFFYHILAFICGQIKNTYDKLKSKRVNKKRK